MIASASGATLDPGPDLTDLSIVHVPVLAAIHRSAYPEPERWNEAAFAALLGADAARAWGMLASDGSGLALLRTVGGETEILSLVVHPDRRRRGIGSALLGACLGRVDAAAAGSVVFLEVEAANRPARALYARHGFAEIAERASYYGAGRHAVVMRRGPAR